jgi:hypothetical protein
LIGANYTERFPVASRNTILFVGDMHLGRAPSHVPKVLLEYGFTLLLYLFLCLVADRQGLSYYGKAKIQSYFRLAPEEIDLAIQKLIQKDMIAYDGRLYQILSLPTNNQGEHRHINPASNRRTSEPERIGNILKRLAEESR